MKKYFLMTVVIITSMISAETLFEVKDSLDRKVLDVSTDGLRILNEGDTLMVISPSGVKINLDNSTRKALSRTFTVATSTSKGTGNAFEVGIDSTKIGTFSTTMGSGLGKYTDFSPDNIFLGLNAGNPVSPGIGNVFVGNDAGRVAANSLYSTFIGTYAGYNTIGGMRNTYVGYGSAFSNIGGYSNSFFGDYSGYYNTSGYYNSFFGKESGYNNTTGHSNTALGFGSGYGAAEASYSYNSIFGAHAGRLLTTGSNNVMIGYYAGYKSTTGATNVYLGEKAGYNSQTGTGNIFLGYNSGYNETASNKLYVANSNTSTPIIKGNFPNVDIAFNAADIYANGNLTVKGGTSIGMTQAGSMTVGTFIGQTGPKTITLTFPKSFNTIPKINFTPKGATGVSEVFAVTVRDITTTGCVVMIYKLYPTAGGSWTQSLLADWYAWE